MSQLHLDRKEINFMEREVKGEIVASTIFDKFLSYKNHENPQEDGGMVL